MFRNLFIQTNIRILLAKTYLLTTTTESLPTLLYGCELYASCVAVSRRRLNVTYNAIDRYMFGFRRNRSISHFGHAIYSVTFDNLMNCQTLLFLYKIFYNRQPPYLYERLIFSRSNRENKINSIKYNKAISQQHYFIHSIRL